MLKRVHIKDYKSLMDVEVSFEPLSVLFGPNAAGKSNLLDALQLLSRITASKNLKEAFDPPYRGKPLESFHFGPRGIEGLLEQESVSFSIEVDIKLSESLVAKVNNLIAAMKQPRDSEETQKVCEQAENSRKPPAEKRSSPRMEVKERNLRYRIEVEMLPRSGILRVRDEYLAALNEKNEPTGARRPFIEREGNRLHLRMEGQSHPRFFEMGLDHTVLSVPHYAPHHPHLTAAREELSSWLFFYFEPRERMRAATPVKEVRHIGLMGEELAAYLNTLRATDERQFRAVEKALRTVIPSITGIQMIINKLGEVEMSLLEGDIAIPARLLSEGTLRILGLLALSGAKEPPALLCFEEPENGVHPRRIGRIAQVLRNRTEMGDTQIVVTTHSPVLLDEMPNTSLYICKRERGNTAIRPLKYPVAKDMLRASEIDRALQDQGESDLPVSDRIMRGDFE